MASNNVVIEDLEEPDAKNLNIFLSYQWKSQEKVRKLYNELIKHECFNVFMDIYKIKAGMNLYATLAVNLQQADIILACVSREYVKSKNCEREIIYSDAFNKPIIPLYIEKIPMQELGAIGFILVRERFCSLYRNENIFEKLRETDEYKDILGGIKQVVDAKSLKISKPIESVNARQEEYDEKNVPQSVIEFRNDKPLEQLIKIESPKEAETSNVAEKSSVDKKVTSQNFDNRTRSSVDLKNKTPSTISKPKEKPKFTPKFINFLEIHPVIKELAFLRTPKIYLDPLGDRFSFEDRADSKRGGEKYYKPVGWIRYGLDIKKIYPNVSKWLAKDGNADEWAVAYHGFKSNPLKSALYSKLFDKDSKLNPNFEMSNNLNFVKVKDVNKRSSTFNNSCGLGIFCSPKPDSAGEKTAVFILNDVKYKMLLQCRVNPTRIKIPQNSSDLYIVSSNEHIRPYGILIKEVQ